MQLNKNSEKRIIESLQGLRAIAALLVVLLHLNGLLDKDLSPSALFGLFNFGGFGVDLFFVLSGFIIYYTVTNKPALQLKEYLYLRFVRIFPIYWIAIFTTLAMFLVFNYLHFSSDGYVATAVKNGGWLFVLKSIFLIPTTKPLIAVSWTLSFEVVFYSLFCLYFWQRRFFHAALVFWLALSLSYAYVFHMGIHSEGLQSLLNPIIAEFAYGCFIAYLYKSINNKFSLYSLFVGVTLLGIVIYLITTPTTLYSNRGFYLGIPAAFIVYGVLAFKKCPLFLKQLGDASYSLYLFHFPILAALVKICAKLGHGFQLNSTLIGIVLTFTIVSISWAIYRYVEQPLLNALRSKRSSIPYTPAIAIQTAT